MMRWRRFPLILLAVALVVVALPVADSAATATVKSTVTITTGEGTEFTGKVSSPKKFCRGKRTVKLFRADTAEEVGELVGTTKTNSAGAWTLDGSFVAGYFYARVLPKIIHMEKMVVRCGGDRSISRHF